ncbi:MAG: hypothetical protein Q3M24_18500 [Candidatus Electrothrix aestuarii]|uniref:Uncharacterized protein n=1 Tax=Candidatus Electrothrix aestuarii TaxID=3062594 RepID=A0AAU8LSV4_9BACT|nr:hypothetical protein [Candidatus Electrothrix aestuarii]
MKTINGRKQFIEIISGLSKDSKLLFYEEMSHCLTVCIRSIWSNNDLAEKQIIDQIKWVNEIQHRVTSKISVDRQGLHEWTESDFIDMVKHYVDLCPAIRDEVAYAINTAYSGL